MKKFNRTSLRATLFLEEVKFFVRNLSKSFLPSHVEQSIRVAFPNLSTKKILKLYCSHRLSMRSFTLIKSHLSKLSKFELTNFLEKHVSIDGKQYLDSVKLSNQPVIFVTPHYGNFAAGCLKLIAEVGKVKKINAFYNPPSKNKSSEGFEELFMKLGFGFNPLFNDDTSVLKALRVLKRGEALTMMPDVFDISGHVLYVPFFERLIPAMAGTALFALKGKATVIVGFNCPGKGLNSILKIEKPLEFESTGNLEQDICRLTKDIFRVIEKQIRLYPQHWVYLPAIGDLLNGRLNIANNGAWLETLDNASEKIDLLLPGWKKSMLAIKAINDLNH